LTDVIRGALLLVALELLAAAIALDAVLEISCAALDTFEVPGVVPVEATMIGEIVKGLGVGRGVVSGQEISGALVACALPTGVGVGCALDAARF